MVLSILWEARAQSKDLTFSPCIEELPQNDRVEYEGERILKNELCPYGPVIESRIRRVSEIAAHQVLLDEDKPVILEMRIPIHAVCDQAMSCNLAVRNGMREVGGSMDHGS